MGTVKIRLNTWARKTNREVKFKRGLAVREGFIEYCTITGKAILKEGEKKWKPWDISIPRGSDSLYIQGRKDLYAGLCFENKKQAQEFMKKHKVELDAIAATNPLFSHWSIMNVIKRFEPTTKTIYGKDVKED